MKELTHKQAAKIKLDNARRDAVSKALADIRATRLLSLTTQYVGGTITADEYLTLTEAEA